MSNRPLIGVTPILNFEKQRFWLRPGYLDAIRDAGGLPVMLPHTDDEAEIDRILDLCSAVLVTGGPDVEPELYGEERLNDSVETQKVRDDAETALFCKAFDRGMPILGICRGMQLINVLLGGTLYQDLPTQNPSEIRHRQEEANDVATHGVTLERKSGLFRAVGSERIDVNSFHHQAIRKPAPNLAVTARADDGVIEAAELPAYPFLWLIQWHPELLWKVDANSRAIFRAFVDAARG